MNIGACILTAGLSSRMGEPKALLSIHNVTFLENIVNSLNNSGITRITAITGHHTEQIRTLCLNIDVPCIHNPDYTQGQFTSVCMAVRAMEGTDGFLMCLVDHPVVEQIVYDTLIFQGENSIKNGLSSVIVPSFDGRGGHPVFIPSAFYDDILSYEGDGGLRAVFKRLSVTKIEVGTDSILKDIDTKEDYSTLNILTQNS